MQKRAAYQRRYRRNGVNPAPPRRQSWPDAIDYRADPALTRAAKMRGSTVRTNGEVNQQLSRETLGNNVQSVFNLLQVYDPSRALRSSTQQLLHVPYT